MTRRPLDDDPADRIGQAYDRHATGLYRYALMLLGDTASAADAVQEAFLRLVRRRQQDEHVEREERYLRRAVRNECYSTLRRRIREPISHDRLIEPVGSTSDDPEIRAGIEQALRALPPEQREVVHLKVFDGMTFQEIADVSDESINTIASRYRYAMDKLRASLRASK